MGVGMGDGMDKRYLLGVDIGTYESKGVVTTLAGKVVATATRPHELLIPQAGWAEHDADLLGMSELGRSVHGLGRLALGVADDQLDLSPVHATGGIDLLHGELDAAVDTDPG